MLQGSNHLKILETMWICLQFEHFFKFWAFSRTVLCSNDTLEWNALKFSLNIWMLTHWKHSTRDLEARRSASAAKWSVSTVSAGRSDHWKFSSGRPDVPWSLITNGNLLTRPPSDHKTTTKMPGWHHHIQCTYQPRVHQMTWDTKPKFPPKSSARWQVSGCIAHGLQVLPI